MFVNEDWMVLILFGHFRHYFELFALNIKHVYGSKKVWENLLKHHKGRSFVSRLLYIPDNGILWCFKGADRKDSSRVGENKGPNSTEQRSFGGWKVVNRQAADQIRLNETKHIEKGINKMKHICEAIGKFQSNESLYLCLAIILILYRSILILLLECKPINN